MLTDKEKSTLNFIELSSIKTTLNNLNMLFNLELEFININDKEKHTKNLKAFKFELNKRLKELN